MASLIFSSKDLTSPFSLFKLDCPFSLQLQHGTILDFIYMGAMSDGRWLDSSVRRSIGNLGHARPYIWCFSKTQSLICAVCVYRVFALTCDFSSVLRLCTVLLTGHHHPHHFLKVSLWSVTPVLRTYISLILLTGVLTFNCLV